MNRNCLSNDDFSSEAANDLGIKVLTREGRLCYFPIKRLCLLEMTLCVMQLPNRPFSYLVTFHDMKQRRKTLTSTKLLQARIKTRGASNERTFELEGAKLGCVMK